MLPAAQVLRVAQERADRLTARFEDRRVTRFRVGAQQWPQLLGNRKGDDKMLHRQQFAVLPGQPAWVFSLLAIGTMPIAAGPSDPVCALTTSGTIDQVAQFAGSTPRDQPQDLAVMRRHPGLILGDVIRCKLSQCIGDGESVASTTGNI